MEPEGSSLHLQRKYSSLKSAEPCVGIQQGVSTWTHLGSFQSLPDFCGNINSLGPPSFFLIQADFAPFADIRHQDTLVLLIWRNLPGRVVWLLWIYTFVPCISRSFHPMVLLEPFWRLQACCCPSHFDIWLISLYRNIVVSETTSAAPFLLTTEGSSWHSLNSVSRASWLSDDTLRLLIQYWDQTFFCDFDPLVLTKLLPTGPVPPRAALLQAHGSVPQPCLQPCFPDCPLMNDCLPGNCILVPQCSKIWYSNCGIALAVRD